MHSIAKIATILVVCSLGALAISHQKMREYEFDRVTLYFRRDAPENSAWMNVGSPASDDLVSFTLFLKQRNLHLLEQALLADSDPHSAKYGQHWTREEILDLIAPTPQVQKEVLTWLYSVADVVGNEHIISLTNAKDSINVIASVKFAEKLFATQLFKFENSKMNKEGIKHLGELSVPRSVADYIEIITGVTDFMPPIKQTVAKKAPRDDDNQCNVPYSIKNLYNVPLDLTVTNPSSNQSIYAEAYQQDGFGFGSLAYWETANGIASNPINCILGSGASFIIPNDTDGEAQLDTQMMTGMAVGAKTCFWMIEGWMLDFAVQMFINPKTPLVISASYGWTEWDQCDNVTTNGGSGLGNCSSMHIPNSQQYVNRTNIEFQKIGLTGRTLLVASGDDGNAGGHGSPNGCTKIAPMFPAASPWVLTCGATSIEVSSSAADTLAAGAPPLCTNSQYQCVCSTSTNEQPAQQNNTAEFDSGGGFSVYSPTPSYQKKAVSSYLSSGIYLPPSSFGWNPQGRGYPDIAGVGENFCVLDPGGSCNLVAGTSAASPLIASLVTLLNQDRLNAGKSSLGFINPVIYDMFDSDASQFFNNNFEGTNGGECGTQFGFHSKAGMWSPITGVGSPKFDQIRTYINSLP